MTKTNTTENTKTGKAKRTIRVALYLRGIDETAIALQRAHCTAYVAKRSGWIVTAEYCDIGHARTEHNPNSDRQHDWDRLRQDASAQAFDIVVTYTVSRITRSPRILQNLLNDRTFAHRVFIANTDGPLV